MPAYPRKKEAPRAALKSIVPLLSFFTVLFLSSISTQAESPGPRFEPPTLFVMNSPGAMTRIGKGFFQPVYRGFGQRTPLSVAQNELLGFHFLFDTDCLSSAMLALWKQQQQSLGAEQALQKAKEQHLEVLKLEFTRLESVTHLYENTKRKNLEIESHFLYSTPHLALARFYGPVVMVIEELRPRGLDLCGIARDSKYYTMARFLRNVATLNPGGILGDYVMDRDEYVIPSFISPEDVTGLIVYEPSRLVMKKKYPVLPPRVARVYRKRQDQGFMVIEVFDAQDRLIERLSDSPTAASPDPTMKRSPEKLPEAISVAWREYTLQKRSLHGTLRALAIPGGHLEKRRRPSTRK